MQRYLASTMISARPWLIIRLMATLLLATIGLQALPTEFEPFQQRQGSAFSASTADVALASPTREFATSSAHVPEPTFPPSPGWDRLPTPTPLFDNGADGRWPDPIGPKPAQFLASQLGARPPPSS
jgi:hypothetical protein